MGVVYIRLVVIVCGCELRIAMSADSLLGRADVYRRHLLLDSLDLLAIVLPAACLCVDSIDCGRSGRPLLRPVSTATASTSVVENAFLPPILAFRWTSVLPTVVASSQSWLRAN